MMKGIQKMKNGKYRVTMETGIDKRERKYKTVARKFSGDNAD